MKIKRLFNLLALLMALSMPGLAQVTQNLSNIRVDELSDDQVRAFIRQVESTGLSDAQLEQVATSRGMRPEEVEKLRLRVDRIKKQDQAKPKTNKTGVPKINEGREVDSMTIINPETEAEKALLELKARIFGDRLFSNKDLTFEPNLQVSIPDNYIIGPDDEIIIDITGDNEANYKLKVSREGTIRIEYAGIISVNGLSVEQATQKIRSRLASTYPGIRSGRTQLTISIGNIRSIKVTLLGEVSKPGSYTLSSLATAFNALYASGGPTENGSYRLIEIIRNNRVIAKLDVYEFLLKGFQTNNIRLQDQDIIRIPVYKNRVEFAGEVKRPAIFETIEGETLKDVINFAGEFTDQAYKARIKVLKTTDRERKIIDVFSSEFSSYKPESGDKYFVEPVLDRFENRVSINGAVFRPGQYELERGLTLGALIKKAEGVKEDAFLPRGYITRLRTDNSNEIISFDLNKILAGTSSDIVLQREDAVVISSIFSLREEYKVSIEGEVRSPGTLPYAENMILEDLILKSGGFTEGASARRIEVSRRVKNSNVLSSSASTAEIFQIDIDKDLKFRGTPFILQPFDIVSVRNAAGYEVQRQVRIQGELLYSGTYTLLRRDERISDLVKRAGGLTPLAYISGASLARPGVTDTSSVKSELNGIQSAANDTAGIKKTGAIAARNVNVGINLEKILAEPGSKHDLILEEGDIINIPKQLQTVKVSGEVLSPVTIVYSRGKSLKGYVASAGGFTDIAKRKRSYIKYANGSVKSARRILVFNTYPTVRPGSEIIIPEGTLKRPLSLTELIGVTSSLITIFLLIKALNPN